MKVIRPLITFLLFISLGCFAQASAPSKEILSFGKFSIGEYTLKQLHAEYDFEVVSSSDAEKIVSKNENYEMVNDQVSGHSEYLVANYRHYGITFDHIRLKFFHGILYEVSLNANVISLLAVLKKKYPKGFEEKASVDKDVLNKYSDSATEVVVYLYECWWEQSGRTHVYSQVKYRDVARRSPYEQYFSLSDEAVSSAVSDEINKYWERRRGQMKKENLELYKVWCEDGPRVDIEICQQFKASIETL